MSEAQLRTLRAIHDSLFAPTFRALENYGRAPEPAPTKDDVIEACKQAILFHERKADDMAAEIYRRASANPTNLALLQQAVELRKHHTNEIARIKSELAALTEPQAAE